MGDQEPGLCFIGPGHQQQLQMITFAERDEARLRSRQGIALLHLISSPV